MRRAGVAGGAPSPTKGTHCRIASPDAASDCKGDAPQRSDRASREGARDIPGDCRRIWDITATGAANRFQESRLRTPSTSAYRPLLLPLRTSCCTAANGGLGPPRDLSKCSKPHRYSMTSSVRASSVGGVVRPSVLTVFRLVTSSNFVDCTTRRPPPWGGWGPTQPHPLFRL